MLEHVWKNFANPLTPHIIEAETAEVRGDNPDGFRVLGDGWRTRDGNVFCNEALLWSTRLYSHMYLTVLRPRPLSLRLRARPRYSASLPAQRVEVFWEGASVGVIEFDPARGWADEVRVFAIPETIQRVGPNQLTFANRYAVSAHQLQDGNDTREVAFALSELRIKDASGPPAQPKVAFEENLVRLPAATRLLFPARLPSSGPPRFKAQVRTDAADLSGLRVVLRWDSAQGGKELTLLNGSAAGIGPLFDMDIDLLAWANQVVEIVFDTTMVSADTEFLVQAPRIVLDRPPPAREAAPVAMALKSGAARNVILVVLDALRAGALGCYGHIRGTSPFIDELAATGVLFEQAHSADTYTFSSVASLLTSLYVFEHKVVTYLDTFRYQDIALQQVLGDQGIATACVSQNPFISLERGLGRRFDEFRGCFGHDVETCHAVTRSAIEVAQQMKDSPFFLYVHYLPPHAPYEMAGPFLYAFSEDLVRSVELTIDAGTQIRQGLRPNDARALEHYRLRYDECARMADELVRNLVTGLRDLGLGEETVLILTSDHGEEFGEHGWVGHGGAAYATLTHVPLIITTLGEAGVSTPLRRRDVVTGYDVYPTILSLFGCPPKPHCAGIDLLQGAARAGDGVWAFSNGLKESAVQAFQFEQYKLLRSTRTAESFVFQRENDPSEKHDVSTVFPVLRNYLEAEAVAWQQQRARYFEGLGIEPIPLQDADESAPTVEHVEELKALGYL